MNAFTAGTLALVAGALFSATAFVGGLLAQWRGRAAWAETARRSLIGVAVVLTAASVLLIVAFVLDRFELSYVAYNSNRTMPLFYKVTAFWGSLDGSMLLWAWLLALFGAVAMWRHRERDRQLLPVVAATMGAILLFFTVTILVTTNPFDLLRGPDGRPFVPPDGLGLNPLLQNPGMAFHPPSLYLGFTGFTIPFAFAVAALVTGRLDADWIRSTRRWTLVAWGFLTLGNLLGANWAYVELGWGGYWGWDPVENSSLMPWLTGTAFLHSVMIQEKKGMLKIWNVTLIMVTFWLTIFGTFLTRSGVVTSVHAFSNGTVGPIFLGFLAVAIFVGLGLLLWRWDELRTGPRIESPLSREGAFLYNNVVFVAVAFATFWGTVFPILNELVTGQKITIGAPFFNKINAPLAIGMLGLLGVGPVIAWRRSNWRNFRRQILPPLVWGLLSGAIVWLLGIRKPYPVIVYVLVVFAFYTIVDELVRGTWARRRRRGEAWPVALWRLIRRNPRRYGGYVVHVGVLAVFVGITGNFFARATQVIMGPGDTTEFAGYRIELQGIRERRHRNYTSQMAIFTVTTPDGKQVTMWPEKRRYRGGREEVSTEVAIRSTLAEDLYLIFVDPVDGARGSFRFHLNPLVQLIWIGGGIMALGLLLALPSRRKERR